MTLKAVIKCVLSTDDSKHAYFPPTALCFTFTQTQVLFGVHSRCCGSRALQSDRLLPQPNWLAPSPRSVGGPMVMNVFSFLWSPLYCSSMPGRMKNRLKRQETDTERMFGCWLLSYQPFSHLMKQLSAPQLIKYPPVTGQSCGVARPWESYIRF